MASNATATNTAANAVDNSPQAIEGDGTLIASTPETGTNTVLADAENTNGDATATADSNESAAVVDSGLSSDGNASVVAREHLSITADAETTTGNASADADNDSNEGQTGGLINSNQSVGGDYAQSVDVDNSTTAAAATTDGNADADATEDSSFGILRSDIDVEGNYNSTVDNDNSISSRASTTDGSADADSDSNERTGIRFGVNDVLDVEGNATLGVTVGSDADPNTVSATANVVGTGDATATVSTESNYGITGESIVDGSTPVPAGEKGQASNGAENDGFGAIFNLSVAETLDPLFQVTGLLQQNGLSGFGALEEGDEYTLAFFTETTAQIANGTVSSSPFTSNGATLIGTATGTVDAAGNINASSGLPADVVGSVAVIGTQGAGGSTFKVDSAGLLDGDGGTITTVGATIAISGDASIDAEVDNAYEATASSTTGNSSATTNTSGGVEASIGSGETIGIDAAVIDVEGNATNIEGTVNNESTTEAETTTGDATATDVSGLQAGIQVETLDVAGSSVVTGSVTNSQTAQASSVTEDEDEGGSGAQASAQTGGEDDGINADIIGIDAETLNLEGDATINGSADVSQVVGADITTGDAKAEGLLAGNVMGIDVDTDTTADGDLNVTARASVGIESSASNTSGADEWAVESESTIDHGVDVIGLSQDSDLSVGGNYSLNSLAYSDLDATAVSTADNADAESKSKDSSDIYGAEFDGRVNISGDATIVANAVADFDGNATTTAGDAYADARLEDIAGLRVDNTDKTEGKDFQVEGDALLVGNTSFNLEANATSTSGSADSDAETDEDARGIEITDNSDGLEIEGNAIIAGNVTAELNASAISVGDEVGSGEDEEADAEAELDGAQGIFSDDEPIDVDGNLELSGNVIADLSAQATIVTGEADADAKVNDDNVAGIDMDDSDSEIDVEGNADIDSSVDLTLEATAISTTGRADAEADVEQKVESADFDGEVNVRGDATIDGDTDVVAGASATTTTGNAEADTNVDDIEGLVFDDDLNTGGDATLTSETDATLTATAVSTTGDADAEVEGVDAITAIVADEDIDIGGNFSATGTVNLTGTASSETVNKDEGWEESEAEVKFTDDIEAVDLYDTRVAGNAVVNGTTNVDLSATALSVNTNADASTKNWSEEVEGVDIDDILDAEGDVAVTGRAELTAAATADTTDGQADAKADSEGVHGIQYEDIEGADVALDGDAVLDQMASASTTDGDANATVEQDNEVSGVEQTDGNWLATEAAGSLNVEGDATSLGDASAATVDGDAVAIFEAHDDVVGAEFDDSVKSFGDMDVTGNALLDASTAATSVSGVADAYVFASGAEGIEFDANVYADGDANLDGSASVITSAVASSTGDDEEDEAIATTDIEHVVGLDADDNDDTVDVDGDLIASGSASAMQTAEASIVTGDAIAEINQEIWESEVTGAEFSTDSGEGLDVLGDATVTGSATVNNNASASSTTGYATASEQVSNTTGLIDDLMVGGDATVEGTANLTGSASASTVEGDADAQSGSAAIFGDGSEVIGYDAAGTVNIGGNADVTGTASTNNSADAVTVEGDASALSGHDDVIGISINNDGEFSPFGRTPTPSLEDSFRVAGDGTFEAAANTTAASNSATTTGDAFAGAGVDQVIGLDMNRMVDVEGEDEYDSVVDELGDSINPASGNRFQVDGDTTIDASANFNGSSTASADTGNALAAVDANDVIGVNSFWEDIIVSGDADISASAVSTQNASASTTTGTDTASFDELFSLSENGGAVAITGAGEPFSEGDDVIGSDDTDYFIAGNASQFDTRAALDATSKANAVTGDALAFAGIESASIGFESDLRGEVNIAGNVTGDLGILSYATSDLTTEAQTTSGDAFAGSEYVVVKGAENMDLDVGGNVEGQWGARALALGNFNASAESVDGDQTVAFIDAFGRGFDSAAFESEDRGNGFGDIDIQGSGNITQIAQMVANAQAVTVGEGESDWVIADVNLDAVGGDFDNTNGDITINGNGNVSGDGVNRGSSSALGVTTGADAIANVNSEGFRLDDSTINIGGTGDVQGRGLIGSWGQTNNGDYVNTEVFSVSAETTNGDATAYGGESPAMFNAIGIGGEDGAMVTAGASGGDITGIAGAAADLSAATTNGDAWSDSSSELFGINNVTLNGGRDGASTIDGRAQGLFTTSSNSVNGDADAISNVSAIGMSSSSLEANANGNVNALAELSNTVTASTVTGAATATATGNAVGIQGYDINLAGNGVITANASANIVAQSSTINGEMGDT